MIGERIRSGRLVDGKGGPLAGRLLTVRLDYADGVQQSMTARADASGRFELGGLVPGVVTLAVETQPAELSGPAIGPFEIKPGELKDLGDVPLTKAESLKVH